MDTNILKAQLVIDEGDKRKPYVDTVGKVTIGVGHNLTDRGISQAVRDLMLSEDVDVAIHDLDTNIPWWRTLSENRQQVLANMCFNMGWPTLVGFKGFLKALYERDWPKAGSEMKNSIWFHQVGQRAQRLLDLMMAG